jgi:hypothetical protein
MRTIAYCGPSIEAHRAGEIVTATFAPPIRRGDLAGAADYDLVVILDGEFGQSLAVSPKEILTLLDAGKTVIGGGSMGALRASEIDHFGMIGVGWIYRRFKAAPIRCDDEVALTFSPFDGRAMTVPLVNVEYWLEGLDRERHLARGEATALRRAARRIFFAERTEEALMAALRQAIGGSRLRDLLRRTGDLIPDIKRQDAEEALRLAACLVHQGDSRTMTA